MNFFLPYSLPACFEDIWSNQALIDEMMEFEKKLAVAQTEVGLLDQDACSRLEKELDALTIDFLELEAGICSESNLAVPFVRWVKNRLSPTAQKAFHLGATSQDLIDTSLVRLSKKSLERLVELLSTCCEKLSETTALHTDTLIMGRTLNQAALPTSLGLKLAGYLNGLSRVCGDFKVRLENLPVQFGGAVGNHAALGEEGLEVMEKLAGKLGLSSPQIVWHTDRRPLLEVVLDLIRFFKGVEKIAEDFFYLGQSGFDEIGEKHAGSSSAMPHKRNPVKLNALKAFCCQGIKETTGWLNLPPQLNERGGGSWHAEWQIFKNIHLTALGTAQVLKELLQDLQFFPSNMWRNLLANQGYEMAENLVNFLKKKNHPKAKENVEEMCRQALASNLSLKDLAKTHNDFSDADLEFLFDRRRYTGSAKMQIERILKVYRKSI